MSFDLCVKCHSPPEKLFFLQYIFIAAFKILSAFANVGPFSAISISSNACSSVSCLSLSNVPHIMILLNFLQHFQLIFWLLQHWLYALPAPLLHNGDDANGEILYQTQAVKILFLHVDCVLFKLIKKNSCMLPLFPNQK